MKMTSTEYTAVPANIVSPTDTIGYRPAASYPLQPVGQTASQSAPPAYDPAYDSRTAHVQQQQTNTVVVATGQSSDTTIVHVPERPSNYLALSIVNLLCCCFPLGVIALIYSLRVDSEYVAGHYEEAKRSSESAKSINYVSIGIGSCIYITITVVVIIYVVAAVAVASGE